MPASLHTQLSECRSVLARERDALNAARANVDTLRAKNARLRAALEAAIQDVELSARAARERGRIEHATANAKLADELDSHVATYRAALTR